MKILILISALVTVAVAQQPFISCLYQLYNSYGCELSIHNPDGLNDFTEIGGIHLEGYTNADVAAVYTYDGITTNVPTIICETFPNVVEIMFYNTGLTQIGDSEFSGCTQLRQLELISNRISSITPNAFANLPELLYLNLYSNALTTLPANVFENQRNVSVLTLSFNPFEDIPVGIFRPLENIREIIIDYANIRAINSQWFGTHPLLSVLYFTGNTITLSADSFVGLESVRYLDMGFNEISEIPAGTFAPLINLEDLFIYGNAFTRIEADSFENLENLILLELGQNPIEAIDNGAFRRLTNLEYLSLTLCNLRQLESNSFEGLENLGTLHLGFNQIEELPEGVFVPLTNLVYVSIWGNRLKTLNRNRFASLTNLETFDLDGNVINAIEQSIIDDAVNLETLYLGGNLCASGYFGNFLISRAQYLPMLARCFTNFRYIVDTTTEGDDEYSFFEGPNPGIALRVNSGSEVQIALTPFNFVWNPVIEILIGATNNTRSIIRMNQETNVVTVPTPNIIAPNQFNDFRITWANQNILVFRGNDTFPFMGFTMQHFFPVNFYGLRAVETTASWTVQPFEL